MANETTKAKQKKPSPYAQVVVQQLNAHGDTWRSFASMVERRDLDDRLFSITRAFNMSATRVLVDGIADSRWPEALLEVQS